MPTSPSQEWIDATADMLSSLEPLPGKYLPDAYHAGDQHFAPPFLRLSARQYHQVMAKADAAECDIFILGERRVGFMCTDAGWVLKSLKQSAIPDAG